MIILGVYGGHDSNFCVVKDGVILRHIEAERVSRKKHQRGFHKAAMQAVFDAAGVTLDQIDCVAVGGSLAALSDDPWPEVAGPIEAALADIVKPLHDFSSRTQTGAPEGWVTTSISLAGRAVPMIAVNHHLSHAALAYYTSPYPSCCAVSWDGGGDGSYLMYLRGTEGRITECVYNPPANRLGLSIGAPWSTLPLLYPFPEVAKASAADKYLLDLEGKVMGHAAYARARPDFRDLILNYMRTFDGHSRLLAQATIDLTSRVDFSTHHSASLKQLSASLQAATEEMMLTVLGQIVRPNEPIAVTGGCAYNCVANGALFKRYPQIYVPSCPHDGGLSLGAALLVWHHIMGNSFAGVPEQTPYLGRGEFRAPMASASQVVSDLLCGKIVAWFDGPSECGKRALGGRSILLDPRRMNGKEFLNSRVKRREWFRPFAPSVLAGRVEWTEDGIAPPSHYMGFSCSVHEQWRERIPAVTHFDGSCRPQIVARSNNPVYHEIIRQFDEATGVPMILNTSFNMQEPIVDTPQQALTTFHATEIDVLYLHGERHAK